MSAKPHDGMIWAVDPASKLRDSQELALPFAVIKEGFDRGIWDALNARLGLLLDEYEGARIENRSLEQFANVLTELSEGVTPRTRATLTELVDLAVALKTSGMDMWIAM